MFSVGRISAQLVLRSLASVSDGKASKCCTAYPVDPFLFIYNKWRYICQCFQWLFWGFYQQHFPWPVGNTVTIINYYEMCQKYPYTSPSSKVFGCFFVWGLGCGGFFFISLFHIGKKKKKKEFAGRRNWSLECHLPASPWPNLFWTLGSKQHAQQ